MVSTPPYLRKRLIWTELGCSVLFVARGKLDKNGDGFVEFNELFDALKEGSPDRAELMKLFSQAIGVCLGDVGT